MRTEAARRLDLRRVLTSLLALGLIVAVPAQAKKIYKIVGADGITHYTDRPPDADVQAEVIAVRAEEQPIAALRLEEHERTHRALVSNRIAGVIQVELRLRSSDNVRSHPVLPLRTLIAPNSEQRVAELGALDPHRGGRFEIEFAAVPGDPAAQPDGEPFFVPLDGDDWRIDQGFGGGFSHTAAESFHAIDFAVPEGTPVLAAREGVVMQVEDDFEGAGLDLRKFGSRANHVRLLHADGSMSVYAHLQPESVVVRSGQRVRLGQRLGLSGNTGYSSGPHLHFAVQVNRGMALETIPIELIGSRGPVPIPGAR